jgi:hypothetical protein
MGQCFIITVPTVTPVTDLQPYVKFLALITARMKMVVFWVVAM